MKKDITFTNLDPSKLGKESEKMQYAYAVFEMITKAIDNHIEDKNGDRHEEMDFVVSIVMNLMINRPYCVNCFMTRLMDVVDEFEEKDILFMHSSEEEKQKMN